VLFVLIITPLLYVVALLAFIFRLLLLFRELLVIFSCWSNLWNLFGRKGRKDNYFSMLWCLVGRMQNMCFFFVW
jgi:hypothetical protein